MLGRGVEYGVIHGLLDLVSAAMVGACFSWDSPWLGADGEELYCRRN